MREVSWVLLPILLSAGGCTAKSDSDADAIDIDRPGRPVAMLCDGTLETVEIKADGEVDPGEPFKMAAQEIFVFDTLRKTIYNGKITIGDWYNFCDLQQDCRIEFDAARVLGTMKDDSRIKRIVIDRQTGAVNYDLQIRSEDGSMSGSKSIYQCVPADVPADYRQRFGPPRF